MLEGGGYGDGGLRYRAEDKDERGVEDGGGGMGIVNKNDIPVSKRCR